MFTQELEVITETIEQDQELIEALEAVLEQYRGLAEKSNPNIPRLSFWHLFRPAIRCVIYFSTFRSLLML